MASEFRIVVNGNLSFELSEDEIDKIDALAVRDRHYSVLHENKTFDVEIASSDFNGKSYRLKVNGTDYRVAIIDASDILIDNMGFASGSAQKMDSISAPMPGLILEVKVKEGQEVDEDEPLLILEAMKMENIISSPRTGVIKKISVKKGEAVEKQHLLLEFE